MEKREQVMGKLTAKTVIFDKSAIYDGLHYVNHLEAWHIFHR
jgi:hypothetical protein